VGRAVPRDGGALHDRESPTQYQRQPHLMSLFQIHPPHSVILSQYSYFTINTLFPLSLHTTRLSNSPRSEHGPNLTLESRAVRRTHPTHAAHHLPPRPSQALPGKCFVCAFAQLLSHFLVSSVKARRIISSMATSQPTYIYYLLIVSPTCPRSESSLLWQSPSGVFFV
jgi:hypothetical protein